MNGLIGVVYMPNKNCCNAARANEVYDMATRAPWMDSRMGACEPLVLTMDSLPSGFGLASSSLEVFQRLRQGFAGATTPLASAYAPVSLRLLDDPAD